MVRWVLLPFMLLATAAHAQVAPEPVPRTHDGRPDFGGVWLAAFLTPLERRKPDQPLVASPELRAAMEAEEHGWLTAEGVEDPDITHGAVRSLNVVRGEARTSQIISPADGQMPLTQRATDMVNANGKGFLVDRDNPENRPLAERCLAGFLAAPIRVLPLEVPFRIVQTPDTVVMTFEDISGLRIVPLSGPAAPALTSIDGISRGRWEGESLVIRTTGFRAEYPFRELFGRPMVVGPDSVVIERFTLHSDDELVYQFTIEDPALYSAPWMGEFAFRRSDFDTYEYACHEANYTLVNVLLGGRMADLKAAAAAKETGNNEPKR